MVGISCLCIKTLKGVGELRPAPLARSANASFQEKLLRYGHKKTEAIPLVHSDVTLEKS